MRSRSSGQDATTSARLSKGASAIRRELARFDYEQFGAGLALAISLPEEIDYPLLRCVAEAIAEVVNEDQSETPLVVTLEADVAKSLGRILKQELGLKRELVCVDGIESESSLEFIDVGEPLGLTEVIPVTIKSLVFPHP
jgi:ethanolamine utilization protein EutA